VVQPNSQQNIVAYRSGDQLSDSGQFRSGDRLVQQQAAVLQNALSTAPLSTARDLGAMHYQVALAATLKTEK
jgi:hypothetical protein